MSVGSQALERSALEAKDRESLYQIATALGGKPGSRAKKADIISMILELAGVTSGSPEPSPATPRTRGGRAGSGSRDEDSRQLALAEGDEADDESETSGAEAPTALTEDRAAVAASAGADTDTRADDREGGDDAREGRGAEGRGRGQDNRQHQRDQARGDQARGDQARGDQARGDQAGRDESENGNRRRRRRGRDRERGQGAEKPAAGSEEAFQGEPVEVIGLLDLRDEGYGFLRVKGYLPTKDDVYVSVKQVRQFGLRKGDQLKGAARPASRNEKNPALLRIDEVNGRDPELSRQRARFEELTPLFPEVALRLEQEDDPQNTTTRVIDLVAPLGKGARGLVVSPPRTGKTTLLREIAAAIEANDPETHIIVLLVDERPEEVTDMRREVDGEVVASTFDRPADEHTMVAELVLERAKRLVEDGEDVVVLLDGLTRLVRAYNLAVPPTGRVLAGGLDSAALYSPKRFFGAARNVEEGGSLTILATIAVDTGSKMDEVIFEEFMGTANSVVGLDRDLADRRIFPAIDIAASTTQHDERLFDPTQVQLRERLRRQLHDQVAGGDRGTGLEMLVERMASAKTNDELLDQVARGD